MLKLTEKFKKKINFAVVRIKSEIIEINWNLPYIIDPPSFGTGTGFFIDKIGTIITCSHVVSGAKNLYIEIPYESSEKHECEVIGICPDFDLAIIRTKKYKPKDYINLGSSRNLNIGDDVYAVGYPLNYDSNGRQSVNNVKFTKGIVSGQQYGLIQTDTAINPGNSGGPLFYNEKVIGINSKTLVSKDVQNIGYSVPIDCYKIIAKNFGKNIIIRRPSLNISYSNTSEKIVKDFSHNKYKRGIMISEIFKNSILNKFGLKVNDILIKFDKYNIDNYGNINLYWLGSPLDIYSILDNYELNSDIFIEFIRNGKLIKQKIKLLEIIEPIRKIYPVFEKVDYYIFGGIIFMNFSVNHIDLSRKNLYKFYKYDDIKEKKLIISYIFPNTPVHVLNNINKYDIIETVNDVKVNDIIELKKAIKKKYIINKIEYIKITNDVGEVLFLPLKEFNDIDKKYSKIYNYPLMD